jgi:hypothetical protein
MPVVPQIDVEEILYGRFPVAATLNRRIRAARPLLRVTLRIRWDDRDPSAALGQVEKELLAFSPGFGQHSCRGADGYEVFTGNGGRRTRGGAAPPGLDGGLALAHLIEHMVIEFECRVADLRLCSGVTGALRRTPGLYHLFVETTERGVGRFCLALALRTMRAQFDGRPPGAEEDEALSAARLAFSRPQQRLTIPLMASALSWSPSTAARALALLRDLGFLREEPYGVNLSGLAAYRLDDTPVTLRGAAS